MVEEYLDLIKAKYSLGLSIKSFLEDYMNGLTVFETLWASMEDSDFTFGKPCKPFYNS